MAELIHTWFQVYMEHKASETDEDTNAHMPANLPETNQLNPFSVRTESQGVTLPKPAVGYNVVHTEDAALGESRFHLKEQTS